MKTILIFMAAGLGSRFGTGIKQLAPVDDYGHIIMDYSIHDAIEAGFNKIIFVIRKDIEADFREIIGNRIESICALHNVEVAYAFQDINDVPAKVPEGRMKPWGTGQAVLAARDLIDSPFVVLNADDYYGKEAFVKMHEWLCVERRNQNEFCMAGFVLKNTLSDNGGVTRGICQVDAKGCLTEVVETHNIMKVSDGNTVTVEVNGEVVDVDAFVSMNMWGLMPEFMDILEERFKKFFETDVPKNPLKAEYLLPVLIGNLLAEKKVSVKVLPTEDKWFGVTYAEDRALVVESFKQLIKQGIYKEDLFSDL